MKQISHLPNPRLTPHDTKDKKDLFSRAVNVLLAGLELIRDVILAIIGFIFCVIGMIFAGVLMVIVASVIVGLAVALLVIPAFILTKAVLFIIALF